MPCPVYNNYVVHVHISLSRVSQESCQVEHFKKPAKSHAYSEERTFVYNLRKMLHVHNAISGKKSDDWLDVTCVYIKVQKNKESNKNPYRIISKQLISK